MTPKLLTPRAVRLLCLAALCGAGQTAIGAADPPDQDEKRALKIFPETHLYPEYVANPRRSDFGVQYLAYSGSEIPDTGSQRYAFRFGGRFELVQGHPAAHLDRGWQIGFEMGVFSEFDREHADDIIGWDGIYGLWASFRPSERVAYRIGSHHVSSHIGDEYIERTGTRRLGYTRNEFAAGAIWNIRDRLATYGEVGWAYDLSRENLQDPWRAQVGIQYESPMKIWSNKVAWYAAVDGSSYQELDWKVDATVQVGIVHRQPQRTWRLGIEHYRGRSIIGEFFQRDEQYTAMGLWLDI